MTTATIHSAEAAAASAAGLPLCERLLPTPDPVAVFRRVAGLPHAVFFDSAMRHARLGRYSFVAADPVMWIVGSDDGHEALAKLRRELPRWQASSLAELPPFQGGWAGLFSYELGRGFEGVPPAATDEFHLPALALGFYDVVIAFDHEQNAAWIISQGLPEQEREARSERARERLARFRSLLDGQLKQIDKEAGRQGDLIAASRLAPQFVVPGGGELRSNFAADDYRRAVRRVIEYIRAGDVFQVNLSQRLVHPARTSSVDLYCRLRETCRAPFGAFFDGGPWQLCSASPERFLRVENGRVETRPIKGTRPRSNDATADRRAAEELLASSKDRAENVMIVDLLRNDLSRSCRPESVRVSQLCGLESFSSVHHLVSVVEGQLRDECGPLELLQTCLPGGSVTGAPKIRAMQIISELEPTARGAYCGAFGYLGVDGRMDTSILIRTVTAAGGWWQLPVGGGIVADSNPDEEYAETWHKAAGILAAFEGW